MEPFVCYKCNTKFNQKDHLHNHLERKHTCQKCNKGFVTNFAYFNSGIVDVCNYNKAAGIPYCRLNHELVYVTGNNGRKPYFRHKNPGDTGDNKMGSFHIEWQKLFQETEKWFPMKHEQLKNRIADIVLIDDYIVEIQHSNIKPEEVRCRREDYNKHNKEVIWIIDAEDTKVDILHTDGNGYLITFDKEWKFKSYINSYKYILLDYYDKINEKSKIFKIQLDKITTKMIKVDNYCEKDKVVEELTMNPKNIWNLWNDGVFCNPTLIISQKGAGNGKTYGTWKKVIENPDKDTFILLTPKHSEKDVILNELNEQIKRNEYHIEENIEHTDKVMQNLEKKGGTESRAAQYVLKYTHKISNRKVTIIIATVQSFYFNLTEINKDSSDPFSTLIPNFLEGVIGVKGPKINSRTGGFYFAQDMRYLNKKTQIDFDEAQDLDKEHLQCMIKLMLTYGVDIGVVGDKLQSLKYEENLFTEITKYDKIPNINFIREIPVNINRRIEVNGMHNIINDKINYIKNGLLPISLPEDKLLENEDNPFETFNTINIYADDKNEDNIGEYCSDIIDKMKIEIENNYYLPQDILVISPILKSRLELIELTSKIDDMWIDFFSDEEYVKTIRNDIDEKDKWAGWKKENHTEKKKVISYCSYHKSDNGSAINLIESRYKTRIVSTITSKGDGRSLVFVLNTTEATLKLVGDNKIGLKYESSFNVSLTRAKRKLYFQLTENGDDIHQRFNGHNGKYICPFINKHININKLNEDRFISDKDITNILNYNNIEYEDNNTDTTSGFDFTDHCSRYAVYKTILHFIINSRGCGATFKQYEDTFGLDIRHTELPKSYWSYIRTQSDRCSPIDNLMAIPVLKYKHKIYEGFSENIRDKMITIKDKLNKSNYKAIQDMDLNLEDYLLISYMININRYKSKTPLPINELYNIISKLRDENNDTSDFYGKIIPVIDKSKEMINEIERIYGKLHWNMEKNLYYNKKNESDYTLRKTESFLIGNNDNYVVDIVLKTSFSELNYLETMKDIILDRFIIHDPEQTDKRKDIDKYYGKELITYILILEDNKYVKYDWKWTKGNNELKNIIKNGIIKYYISHHADLFNFCYNSIKGWNIGGSIIDDQWSEDTNKASLKDIIDPKLKLTNPFDYIESELNKNQNTPSYITNYINEIFEIAKNNRNEFDNELYSNDVNVTKEKFNKDVEKILNKDIDLIFNSFEF